MAVRYVSVRNTGDASEKINRLVDRIAPAVDISCSGATGKEITFSLSETEAEVSAVVAAGKRERLW